MISVFNVDFKRISQSDFYKIDFSKLKFFIVSQSGGIDTPGNIYFFCDDGAFFMNKSCYGDNFINKILLKFGDWNLINLHLCDFIIIKPDIYQSFVRELCSRNIRDFWFRTTFDIYKECKF